MKKIPANVLRTHPPLESVPDAAALRYKFSNSILVALRSARSLSPAGGDPPPNYSRTKLRPYGGICDHTLDVANICMWRILLLPSG